MTSIEYLNRKKKSIPIFHCWLYKWFGIETKKYKRWWSGYCTDLTILLRTNKIYS